MSKFCLDQLGVRTMIAHLGPLNDKISFRSNTFLYEILLLDIFEHISYHMNVAITSEDSDWCR